MLEARRIAMKIIECCHKTWMDQYGKEFYDKSSRPSWKPMIRSKNQLKVAEEKWTYVVCLTS